MENDLCHANLLAIRSYDYPTVLTTVVVVVVVVVWEGLCLFRKMLIRYFFQRRRDGTDMVFVLDMVVLREAEPPSDDIG